MTEVTKGNRGLQGDHGLQGDPFEYENFTTEQLNNLIGPRGKQGEQGVDGIPGLKGKHGISGKIGETGEKGDRGSKGQKGEQGRPGKSGSDGNSFLYENFTKEQLGALKPQVDDMTNQINEEVQKFRNDMMKTISNITSTHAGGGEVQFKYLDDVDVSSRSATKKFPQYDTATDKIVFDEVPGGDFDSLGDVDISNRSAQNKFPQYNSGLDKIVFDDIDLTGVVVDNIDGGTF